jgi:hypothetical protein
MDKSSKKLLADIANKCIVHGINFRLEASPSVDVEEIECSGYFDEESLVVAGKKDDWIDVLVHEDCHLDQMLDKSPFWQAGDAGIKNIEKWLSGKKISTSKIKKSIVDTILLELDCEIRTVKKIKKYKLKIDTNKYIKQANAYLFSYWAMFRYREWFKFPYNNPLIYNNMPVRFLSSKCYCDPQTEYVSYYKK